MNVTKRSHQTSANFKTSLLQLENEKDVAKKVTFKEEASEGKSDLWNEMRSKERIKNLASSYASQYLLLGEGKSPAFHYDEEYDESEIDHEIVDVVNTQQYLQRQPKRKPDKSGKRTRKYEGTAKCNCKVKEQSESTNRFTRFATEHEILLEIIILLPLTLMAFYIIVIEKGTLTIVTDT